MKMYRPDQAQNEKSMFCRILEIAVIFILNIAIICLVHKIC